jgi:plastocyanin
LGSLRIAAVLAAACVTASALAGDPAPGSVEGTVTVGPELSARHTRFSLYPDQVQTRRTPARPKSVADELANVVVYLESVPPGARLPEARGPYRLEQVDLGFEPHVLAVPKGATVEFPNRDTVFHNVFSLSKVASFDLGRYPSGASRSVKLDTPGVVKVFCHIHSDMSAILLVLDNPFFATPTRDGKFRIEGVPPGEYRVVAWHERAKRNVKIVRVESGASAGLNFLIPLAESPDGG